jgi:parvulin-like peptidyl-prolyl isomerase
MTFDEWRLEVADQLTVRVFYNQEVTRRATVSATDVRKYYDDHRKDFFIPFKVKYRFILINKGKTDEDRAVKKQQVEDTLKKLRDGADFNTVAKEVSEGDTDEVPWRELQDIRPEFHTALKETPAGGISSIIETRDEYYIVKVEERREEGYTPFEDVREPIENKLLQTERDRLHKELIERLTAKHFVERY